MKVRYIIMFLVVCLFTSSGSAQSAPPPTPAAGKWQGPWVETPFGRLKATFYYGPWQCKQRFMDACSQQCTAEGRKLMGCMWLSDLKLEWQGKLPVLPFVVDSGGRYAITHCCCDYKPATDTSKRRGQWKNARDSFREEWAKKFGAWPKEGDGKYWPGHHIRDLGHEGDPVDPNNVLPVQPDIHEVFNDQYPSCYAGGGKWSTVDPSPGLPYSD